MKNKLLALMLTSAFISATTAFASDVEAPDFSVSVSSSAVDRCETLLPAGNVTAAAADFDGTESKSSKIDLFTDDDAQNVEALNEQLEVLNQQLEISTQNSLQLQATLQDTLDEVDQLTGKLTQAIGERDSLEAENQSLKAQLLKMNEKYKTMKSEFRVFAQRKTAPAKAAKASSTATKPAEGIGALDPETTSPEVNKTSAPKKDAAGKSRQTTGESNQATVVIAGFTQAQLDAGIKQAAALNPRRAGALIAAINSKDEAQVVKYMS